MPGVTASPLEVGLLDTVRVGLPLPGVTVPQLRKRGWTYREVSSLDRKDVRATLATPEGVRLSFLGGIGWLSAEASLPRLLFGDNSSLISSWDSCGAGLGLVHSIAEEASGVVLPPVDDWRLARVDAVWAWPVDPALYVGALRWSRLPRCEPRSYAGSVSWLTMQGGRIRARAYDKRLEAGHDVDLPFRLERQTRPRREVVRVEGERVPASVRELTAGHVFGMVGGMMETLGLDKPIPGPMEARRLLIERHGPRRGANLWRILLEVQAFGGIWPSDVAPRTRREREKLMREAGVRSLSWEGALPALKVPSEG